MNSPVQNPCHWRVSTLLSLDTDQVHELACWAVGTLTAYRVVLGRCLLALHESKGFKKYGCSTATHYGSSFLGVSVRAARECKRVADKLQFLPRLTVAAERGKMPWTKLREIVRVASAETEEFWMKLAADNNAKKIQKLVSKTPVGALPGDADVENTCTTEFRIAATPELIQMFRQARRMFGIEQDKAVTGAETLQYLLASFLANQPLDPEVLAKVKEETDRDLQAERALEIPEILRARDLAAEMGLLESEQSEKEEASVEELLTEAIGAVPDISEESDFCSGFEVSESGSSSGQKCSRGFCSSSGQNDPDGVVESEFRKDYRSAELFKLLTEELSKWKNTRVSFGPKARHTTQAQTREILRRDGWQCSCPGCPNRAWLHIHHIKPYSEGGATVPHNLISLCSGCHRNLHNGFLKITPTASGKLLFTDPDGRRLDQQADLELAAWLDYHMGWRGTEFSSHQIRAFSGDWGVFADAAIAGECF